LSETKEELQRAQKQLREYLDQIKQLREQREQLINELRELNTTAQRLKSKVYAGKNLVEELKRVLNEIQLDAPDIDDEWTFVETERHLSLSLKPEWHYRFVRELHDYETVDVSASEELLIIVFTADAYEKWKSGVDVEPVARGRGHVRFNVPRNGTYVIVAYNDLGRDTVFDLVIKRYSTWRYYEFLPVSPQKPYVVGEPGVPSRDIFRLLALYNYWLENRKSLASEVADQLRAKGVTTINGIDLINDTRLLYALSLAALLRDAGFDVSFTAIGVSFANPFEPDSAIVQIRFSALEPIEQVFWDYYYTLPQTWLHVITYHIERNKDNIVMYELYVLIDTYNVIEAVDNAEELITDFNVIYVDGVTELG